TVLTPWRVVNKHLVSTLGGLSFYNEDFSDTTDNGTPALHWVEQEDTENAFDDDSKIIEINSKTGLYALYAATSFFYKQQMEFIDLNYGKINKYDEERIIQNILQNNIYVIAKTPMAKTITQRTLAGYKNWKTNIRYVSKITSRVKDDVSDVEKELKEEFGVMKFDVAIGNPTYQETVREATTGNNANTVDVFKCFQELSSRISKVNSLIYPAKEYQRG